MKSSDQRETPAEQEPDDPRVDLAVVRTELALDRTQLAWCRLAFTFITAGFAIDRGTAALHEARLAAGTAWVKTSHFAGLMLMGGATVLLLATAVAYWREARRLARMRRRPAVWFNATLAATALVTGLGAGLTILLSDL